MTQTVKNIILLSDGTGNAASRVLAHERLAVFSGAGPHQFPAGRFLRRWGRHLGLQAARVARRRLRLGAQAQRSRSLQIPLPQLRKRLSHLRPRLQPWSVHYPRGDGCCGQSGGGAVRVGIGSASPREGRLPRLPARGIPLVSAHRSRFPRHSRCLGRRQEPAARTPALPQGREHSPGKDPVYRRVGHGRGLRAARSKR